MINNVNLLGTQASNPISGSSKCDCQSNNGAFDMIMMSLLKAIVNTNQTDLLSNMGDYINNNQNAQDMLEKALNPNATNANKIAKDVLDKALDLETVNSNRNVSKVRPNSKNEGTNIRIENAIKSSAKAHGIDENLIRAIIKVESDFNPNTVSSAGAKGLMQLMPFNCEDFGVTDPFNIEQNIEGGTKEIKSYLKKYNGNVEMALMAYNGGPTRMARRGVNSVNDIYKMPRETQNYVPKVMKYYQA